jgi:uncharacterized protein
MFPLGSVLFPYAQLPLHVFEPRYRTMIEECLKGDGQFGVVLIERGSEVGGGDERFDVGTVARIAQAGRLPDGRYVLLAVGTRRLRVREWLPEDPYPLASIDVVDDPATDGSADGRRSAVQQLLARVLALRAQLGDAAASEPVLDTDPGRASYEAAAAAGLGPLDAQRLLELDDADARLGELESLLADEARFLELRLSEP